MGRYPWTEVLLFEVFRIAIYYPTRRHVTRVAALAATIYLAARIYATPEVTKPLAITHLVGCRIASHFVFAAYILGSEGSFPDHWRRVRDEVDGGTDTTDNQPSNFNVTKKLWWMLDLRCSLRMVGWVQEPRDCLPPSPPPSRRRFLWRTFGKLIVNGVMADLLTLLPPYPAFDSVPENTLGEVPLLRRLPYVLVFGCRVGYGIDYMPTFGALICVGLGRSSPTLWPDMMGRWRDAYTVRRFWGRTWHQQFRPMLTGLGKLVANKFLKFPRGTILSSCTQLYVAFFLSGIIHVAGDIMTNRGTTYCSLKFFLLQAVAITFEGFVIYVAKRLLLPAGIKPEVVNGTWVGIVLRTLGYCWVALWFCLSLPIWQDGSPGIQFGDVDQGHIARFISNKWK